MARSKDPLSPCVGVCTLLNGRCIGCHRTLEEIRDWSLLSDEEKRKIRRKLGHD